MHNKLIIIWLISALLGFLIAPEQGVSKIFFPFAAVTILVFTFSYVRLRYAEYLLFFSISFASLFGLTQTLTGSHAESSNVILYGLSFYTASIAYLLANNSLNTSSLWSISNPLLLSTGPIALFYKSISYKKSKERFKYYIPFVIIGIFMFKVVASPLTEYFFLLEKTDIVSSLLFAVIFELFIYMNFCGLSLLIYGIFGVLGYRIPLNFKQPFSSANLVEFWRGWHRSLSAVLKILFYKPLRGKFSLFVALMGVYFASAMWHGVTFNFLVWGVFNAIFFWLTIQLLKRKFNILAFVLMPFIIVIGRLIFADSDTNRLIQKLSFDFTNFDVISSILNTQIHSLISLLLGVAIVFIEFSFRNARVMQKRNYKYLRTPKMLALLCFIGLLFISNVGVDYAVYGQR